MTINARLKEFRKKQGLSQAELGKKIGLGQGAISKMEQEGSTIIPQNISLLCDTCGLNEVWLRTGKGEMFEPKEPTDIMERLQDELQLDARDLDLIKAFVELPPEQRQEGIRFLEALSANIIDLLPNPDTTRTKSVQDSDISDTKKDVPDSTSVFKPTAQQATGKLPASDPQDSTAQQTAGPADDDATHAITVNDEELEVVRMMRKEKTPTSGSSSCTTSRRA